MTPRIEASERRQTTSTVSPPPTSWTRIAPRSARPVASLSGQETIPVWTCDRSTPRGTLGDRAPHHAPRAEGVGTERHCAYAAASARAGRAAWRPDDCAEWSPRLLWHLEGRTRLIRKRFTATNFGGRPYFCCHLVVSAWKIRRQLSLASHGHRARVVDDKFSLVARARQADRRRAATAPDPAALW